MKTVNTILKLNFFLLFIILIIAGCSDNSSQKTNDENKVEKSPQTFTIQIKQMAFSPSEITVGKGDTLNFINNDILTHNVTEQVSKLWASPDLEPKQSWKMTARESADYYCTIHPVMKGKIIVK